MKVRPEKFHRNVIFSMIVFTWGGSNKKGAWKPLKPPWVKCRKWFWRNFLACKRNHNESFESLSKTSLHLSISVHVMLFTSSPLQYDHHRHLQTFPERLARKPTKCTTSCKQSKPFKFEAKCRKVKA